MARIFVPALALTLAASPAFAQSPSFLQSAAEELPGVVDPAAVPPTERPPASTVAVLALAGAAGVQISELQDAAQQAIEKRTALKVQTLDPGQEKEVRQCAGDPDCFAQKLRESGSNADLLLTVSVSTLDADTEGGESKVLLGLLLVDARSSAELGGRDKIPTGELAEELPPGSPPTRVMADYIGRVFPSNIWGSIASLKVSANEENAEVELRGAGLSCVTPCTIDRVFPGKYQVLVRKQGFVPYSGPVELKSGQLQEVKVTLEEEKSGISPWVWVAVGAGVVAAGVTTALLVTQDSGPVTICIAQTEDQCGGQ